MILKFMTNQKKIKKRIRKEKSFLGIFIKSFCVCLFIVAIIVFLMTVNYYIKCKNKTTQYMAFLSEELSRYFYSGGDYVSNELYHYSVPIADFTGFEQWRMSSYWTNMAANKFSLYAFDDWILYDVYDKKVIKEFNENSIFVRVCYRNRQENDIRKYVSLDYEIAHEQQKELAKYYVYNDTYIMGLAPISVNSGYIKDGYFHIESFRESYSSDNIIKMELGDMTGSTYLKCDKEYNEADINTSWAYSYSNYGTNETYDIAISGLWDNIMIVDSDIRKETIELADSLINQSVSKIKEESLSMFRKRHWEYCTMELNGKMYAMVYTYQYEFLKKKDFIMYIFIHSFIGFLCTLIISLILSNNIYRKYKINHEMYIYRRTLMNTMAHDLKSPLTVISNYAENLQEGLYPDKNRHYIQCITEQVSYMNNLINEIMELSQNEENLLLEWEEVNIFDLFLEVKNGMKEQLCSKNVMIKTDGEGKILCDKILISTVFRNLLENAVKYVPEEGCINIRISNKEFVIENVYYNEIDIETNKLLEPFVKGGHARSGEDGNGLGLSIVKNICDSHGFKINIESKDMTFIVRIRF